MLLLFIFYTLIFIFYVRVFSIIYENYDDTYLCQNEFLLFIKYCTVEQLIIPYIVLFLFCFVYTIISLYILNRRIILFKFIIVFYFCIFLTTIIFYIIIIITKLFLINNCYGF